MTKSIMIKNKGSTTKRKRSKTNNAIQAKSGNFKADKEKTVFHQVILNNNSMVSGVVKTNILINTRMRM